MKKLFKTALIGIASIMLVACNAKKPDESKDTEKSEESVEPCTAHEDGYVGWFVTGADTLTVDGVKAADNKGGAWDFGGDSFELLPSTVEAVKALDTDLGATLEAAGTQVKAIYTLEGVGVGLESTGWTSRFKNEDGKIMIADGSYCVKIIKTKYSAEDDVWATQQWTPDPKTAHVENLGNYFCPTWQEEADEEGFAWDQNPVVTDGAGIYTIVFVEYSTSSSADTFGYGTAFIKTEDKEGVAYKEEPKEHTYGIVGTINGWGNDGADVAMTVAPDGLTAEATLNLNVNDEWKVRLDSDWATNYGWSNVKSFPADAFEDANGNIKTLVAGQYSVTLTLASGDIDIASVS